MSYPPLVFSFALLIVESVHRYPLHRVVRAMDQKSTEYVFDIADDRYTILPRGVPNKLFFAPVHDDVNLRTRGRIIDATLQGEHIGLLKLPRTFHLHRAWPDLPQWVMTFSGDHALVAELVDAQP